MISKRTTNFSIKSITSFFGSTIGVNDMLADFLYASYSVSRSALEGVTLLSIDEIARLSKKEDVDSVGDSVSKFLHVPYFKTLVIPKKLLFTTSAQELSALSCNNAILQQDPVTQEWFLLTTDPRKLKTKLFRDKKLKPALCSQRVLDSTWRRLYSIRTFFSESSLLDVALRKAFGICMLDAIELGARELYFGIPDVDSYEFSVSRKKYGGAIDPGLRVQLLKVLHDGESESFCRAFDPEGKLDISKIQYRDRDALVCTWGDHPSNVRSMLIPEIKATKKRKTTSHILLIDDDRRFAELLKKGMAAKGFSVSIATSVNDALLYHLETSTDIDLVITDYFMPDETGGDLIDMVRAKRGDLPVIVLTSDEAVETYVAMLKKGGDAVIRKGDDPRILFAWIFRLLEKHNKVQKEDLANSSFSVQT
jgi:CheY-like chemotaxis protein